MLTKEIQTFVYSLKSKQTQKQYLLLNFILLYLSYMTSFVFFY